MNVPGLAIDLLNSLLTEAFGVGWELLRIAIERPQDFLSALPAGRLNLARIPLSDKPHTTAAELFKAALVNSPVSPSLWTELDNERQAPAGQRLGVYKFIIRATHNRDTKQIGLRLLPPRKNSRESVEARRRWGSWSFFELQYPDLKSRALHAQLFELVRRPVTLLGSVWRAWIVDDESAHFVRTNERTSTDVNAPSWASGPPELNNLEAFLDCTAAFSENGDKTIAKRISRLQLLFSTTMPVVPSTPWTIERGPDRNGVPDVFCNGICMTDGNGMASLGVFQEVQRAQGLSNVPSVIQARICGSKGTWCATGDLHSPERR